MGCCILGAVIFGFLLRFWDHLRVLAGLPDRALPIEASAWRFGQPAAVIIAAEPRPLISWRMTAAVMLAPALAYTVYGAPAHAAHIRAELAYVLVAIDAPVDAVVALCHGR